MSTASPEPTGLRERKKAHTRRTLMDTALRLFHENGYPETTTEEIAATVGVSQRTFFRYFPSKEAVLLSAVEDVDELLASALLERPGHESPFTALRNAMRDHWEQLAHASLHQRGDAANLIATSPDLAEANVRIDPSRRARLAGAVAERTGVDAETDPRPWITAAVFHTCLGLGHRQWVREGRPGQERLLACFLRQLDLAPEAVASDWPDAGTT
ncbi:TetR family transcriptional regulator [Nocardiopsis sp. HNM0947]|uniref:TetR family transcriptional regulator n=1 Tax=Nocardiopsis coralli TaxID=2772213 RepID=A0ABR9PEZ6_9ACTN|nr:TetR family transcriptional regulator [Nocardiopsis coralli]MBE3002406.1 TetR family transcriptional regulator [Nocardiopsis coralli]